MTCVSLFVHLSHYPESSLKNDSPPSLSAEVMSLSMSFMIKSFFVTKFNTAG